MFAKTREEMEQWLHEELQQIAEECEAEGYPSHGGNYELRAEDTIEWYRQNYPQWMN